MEFHAFFFLDCLYQIRMLNLNQHKHIINRTDCRFKVLISYADDDIQLAGALINHFYVNIGMGKGGKDSAGRSSSGFHAAAHNCNKGQIGFNINGIRVGKTVDGGHHLLLLIHKFILMHENCHGVDA